MPRLLLLLASFLTFAASSLLYAQSTEEEHVETLEPIGDEKPPMGTIEPAEARRQIIRMTNAFRTSKEREKVQANDKLNRTAEYFADYMARSDRYGHTADGNRPADRAKEHDYAYCIVLENIGYVYDSEGVATSEIAKKFVHGWKQSPPHRKNMLDANVSETGVAIAQSKETGYYYAVQMFGRPRSDSINFQVSNHSDATVAYTIHDRTFLLPPRLSRRHEICRPSDVTFQLWDHEEESGDEENAKDQKEPKESEPPSSKGPTKTVSPENDDQFLLRSKEGQVIFQEEPHRKKPTTSAR